MSKRGGDGIQHSTISSISDREDEASMRWRGIGSINADVRDVVAT
jgi:hypothetical protein